MTFYAVYLLCVAAAAAVGWVDWQLATENLPAPETGECHRAGVITSRGGESSPYPEHWCAEHQSWDWHCSPHRNGPDLSAIIVARPALYHTLATIYTYDPQPMSPFLTDWETGHTAWCRERGIPYQGLARP